MTIYRSIHALAETTNGLYKTECVYGPDTRGWDDVDELELATLSCVNWFNEDRLHSHCHDVPPAEFEQAFYAAQQAEPNRNWNPIARASIRPREVQGHRALPKLDSLRQAENHPVTPPQRWTTPASTPLPGDVNEVVKLIGGSVPWK